MSDIKPFTPDELLAFRQAVDETAVAAAIERRIGRMFASVDETDRLFATIDACVSDFEHVMQQNKDLAEDLGVATIERDDARATIVGLKADLANRRQCSTCCGTPHASGLPCICGGTNNADEELKGLRLAAMKAQDELANVKRYCSELEHDRLDGEFLDAIDAWREITEDQRRGVYGWLAGVVGAAPEATRLLEAAAK